jgi:hypothetical protein
MVARLFVLFAVLSVPAWAEDLVPRILAVEWTGGRGADPVFLTEVLRTTVAQEPSFLVADSGDSPDARLVLAPEGTNQLVATLTDPSDETHNWTKTLTVKGFTASSLRAALETLRAALAASLPPVPPQVREELVHKTVQEVKEEKKQRGLTVTITGRPGTEVLLADGTKLAVPDSGRLVLTDQVQYSSLAFTARQPGFFSKSAEAALTDSDLEVDATLTAIPRWTASFELGNEFALAGQYRLGTGSWFLEGAATSYWPVARWSSNVIPLDTNPLQLPLGPLTNVWWMQAEAGAFWYGSKPEDWFVWGFDGVAAVRLDFYPSGVEISRWFPFSVRLGGLAALKLTPSLSLGFNFRAAAMVSTQNLSLLTQTAADGSRPDVEVLGYRYQDYGNDLETLVPGFLYLRLLSGLELKYWF